MSEIDQELDPQGSVALRVAVLFGEMRIRIFKQTDRLFAGLMMLQWLGAIVAALCLLPGTWAGAESYVNIHLWAAIFLGGALTLLPIALLLRPGATLTRHVVAVCEMLFSALLIDITGCRIETHFYVFGALALLAFYRDWRVLITASAVVAIHHGVFGVFAPQNIYGVSIIQPWRWVQHTAWVVFEDVFLIISITQSLKEMMGLAERQASLETVNARIEQQVDLRTGELERSRTEALHNLEEAQQARGKAETAEQELLKAIKAAKASEARLRRRDAMFRQLFDAVPDLVTVSRLSDGKFIEVNAEFLRRSGLSREKALTTSTLEIGQWVRPEERNLFVQKLKADGHVRELEVDFLLQGVVVPYLASSVVVEVDGVTCTLGVGHDITRIKEGERALNEAQQRLSAQVEELTSTQRELIAAREAAMDARPR